MIIREGSEMIKTKDSLHCNISSAIIVVSPNHVVCYENLILRILQCSIWSLRAKTKFFTLVYFSTIIFFSFTFFPIIESDTIFDTYICLVDSIQVPCYNSYVYTRYGDDDDYDSREMFHLIERKMAFHNFIRIRPSSPTESHMRIEQKHNLWYYEH